MPECMLRRHGEPLTSSMARTEPSTVVSSRKSFGGWDRFIVVFFFFLVGINFKPYISIIK